jgi:hypothetical protein
VGAEMKFKIIVDVEECPYRGKKLHVTKHTGSYHKCKHESGCGECVFEYSTFEALCPLVKDGCLIKSDDKPGFVLVAGKRDFYGFNSTCQEI